jgi:hypothetical protein
MCYSTPRTTSASQAKKMQHHPPPMQMVLHCAPRFLADADGIALRPDAVLLGNIIVKMVVLQRSLN